MFSIQSSASMLFARRQLADTSQQLNRSLEQLSSGLRINSADDDAGGMQIANRLTSHINGTGVASRNANDAISVLQVAEGALQESSNIIHKMRDLAIQSANGTYSDEDREAIQHEFFQLSRELDRIAQDTRFGDKKLLDGQFGLEQYQIGAKNFETVGVSITDMRRDKLGGEFYHLQMEKPVPDFTNAIPPGFGSIVENNNYLSTAASSELKIDGARHDIEMQVLANESAFEVASRINTLGAEQGITAHARTVAALQFYEYQPPNDPNTYNKEAFSFDHPAALSFDLVGDNQAPEQEPVTISLQIQNVEDLKTIANEINNHANKTGIAARQLDNGQVSLIHEYGQNIQLQNMKFEFDPNEVPPPDFHIDLSSYEHDSSAESQDERVALNFGIINTVTVPAGTEVFESALQTVTGTIALSSNDSFKLQSSEANFVNGNINTQSSSSVTIDEVDISTQLGAQKSIRVFDAALNQIDSQRAHLGSSQSKLMTSINNLDNIHEQTSEARSRIRDADFALQTSMLTKQQILQNVQTTMAAQANDLPGTVLVLLA